MSTAIAEVPKRGTVAYLKYILSEKEIEFAQTIAASMSTSVLFRQVALAASRNPDIQKCSEGSIMRAAMDAGALGVDCSGLGGQAYMVPFKGQVSLIVGWRGLVEIAYRSEKVALVDAHVVKENDFFQYQLGMVTELSHRPVSADRGKTIAAWALVRLHGVETPIVEVMTRTEIEAIRSRSNSKGFSPWKTDWDEMARKTVLRRILKRVPSTPALEQALALDVKAEEQRPTPAPRYSTASVLEDPVETAPEEPAIDAESIELVTLNASQIDSIKAQAKAAGVPWDEVEQANGGPFTQEMERGAVSELLANVSRHITKLAKGPLS